MFAMNWKQCHSLVENELESNSPHRIPWLDGFFFFNKMGYEVESQNKDDDN